MDEYKAEGVRVFARWSAIGFLGVSVVVALLWLGPQYGVYSERLRGEAELAHANQSRQIQVTQAMAEREAATQRAAAIAIVGQATKDYPEYRQQEFIGGFADALRDGKIQQIIYVPTEANIPILEAGKR